MLTDLASVPAVFRVFVSRTGPWLEAAVIHDFLTIAWITLDGNGTKHRRKFADEIMRAAMAPRISRFSRRLIHAAIRVAAWFWYPRSAQTGEDEHLYIDMTAPKLLAQLPALPVPPGHQAHTQLASRAQSLPGLSPGTGS